MAMFWPSTKPNARSPCRNDSIRGDTGGASPGHRRPTLIVLPPCCARAASVQPATTPPRSAMNARRVIRHLVSALLENPRHIETERPCGLEVDHQLVFARRLHRKVGRLLALEDAIDIGRCPSKIIGQVRSVGQ